MVDVARVVIAAPASGHGKTTIATGLLAAFAARGLTTAGFKVGPDYIDPGYHTLAAGRPGRNLDPVLVGTDLIAPLFAHGAGGADLAVVEGVMGLYDGRTGAGEHGSTAEVAKLLDAPVILVVDAAAQGRSVAALVHGFRSFGDGVRLAGVILNRVGSFRHEDLLREALEDIGTPVLGALHRHEEVAVPSRHLGLVPAVERRAEAVASVASLAEVVTASVNLDAVLAVARSAPSLATEAWSPEAETPVRARPVVAVAGGPAFSFGYAETVELLRGAGAEVALFDPLHDGSLPEGTRGLVVGGGFPEVYASELSANKPLRASVAALAASGAPIAAECAGLLWLCRTLDSAPMCGVLDADASMTPKLTLGYRDAVAVSPSWLAPEGARVTGHEFHRTAVIPRAAGAAAWAWRDAPPEGYVHGNVHASYLHLHWAAHPEFARRLVTSCV
ncbi:cobyrinate a,c-diamide synthase [Planosporangium mesophilum]|uniref:Hydrogenobyrinate a,c-diamide synthase n=1 Tax=Planosporangium mesophilum TaxID=689768 RepID=A0A8J3X229_9ACTN|nr:cobyrinate a,c-diamide synthase [Planosporangium mesophilum]GII21498.1 hydrogenobyrinate a,c-diamide synthase [Planosporangium mesophilum]